MKCIVFIIIDAFLLYEGFSAFHRLYGEMYIGEGANFFAQAYLNPPNALVCLPLFTVQRIPPNVEMD